MVLKTFWPVQLYNRLLLHRLRLLLHSKGIGPSKSVMHERLRYLGYVKVTVKV